MSDFSHERKTSDSHQDLEANTYQFPVSPANQLARRAKKRPGANPSRIRTEAPYNRGYSPAVTYSITERSQNDSAPKN